ncbi:RagB/SusD family nutrient uptake outer membrane protein [Chitinophaga sp. GCM10012297]|uniref:RagB/SusD family nutrient uptake outer membrane protein n=1 Tax=Chitinophaga chungangae TaxID=2821488 RepID=A0ABS3YA34_9BACT|nr:RagB/SusD family nutrient uptake outer membrane protein [Chitinophaga chungangae]MBO9151532.1 RagB/SusD family nutrient uptake outer membrane protein [Chitinophaga chungangae]
MKKILIHIFALPLLVLGSCNKYLETQPSDFLAPSTYYNTEKELNFALNGVYEVLGNADLYGDNMFYQFDISDEGVYGHAGVVNGVQVYNLSNSDPTVARTWETLYNGVGRANLLLENIDRPNMDEGKRKVIKGETLFLRAYYYFLLAQMWGDVPLVLETTKSPENTQVPRAPLAQVYNQILADLKEAETLVLPIKTIGFGGRVSKSAVRGILARVCLHMAGYPLNDRSKYADARDWAKKVMDDGEAGHALNSSYNQVFINLAADKYDIGESIFEVEFWGNRSDAYTESGRLGSRNGIRCTNVDTGYSLGRINATPRFYARYQPTDDRRDWNIAPYIYGGTDNAEREYWPVTNLWQRSCGKYRRMYEVLTPKSTSFTPINYPILRYADILLMFAEADNELTAAPSAEAVNAVSLVRKRGYGKALHGENLAEITITNGGSGYSSSNPPTVTISGGAGSGASAIATIANGRVATIIITDRGRFYTSNPTVTISGGGTGATATATITVAGDDEVPAADYATKENFRSFIHDERSRELCFEGLRKGDLIRWQEFLTEMRAAGTEIYQIAASAYRFESRAGLNVTEKNFLFPIPTGEMSLNRALVQNPGW